MKSALKASNRTLTKGTRISFGNRYTRKAPKTGLNGNLHGSTDDDDDEDPRIVFRGINGPESPITRAPEYDLSETETTEPIKEGPITTYRDVIPPLYKGIFIVMKRGDRTSYLYDESFKQYNVSIDNTQKVTDIIDDVSELFDNNMYRRVNGAYEKIDSSMIDRIKIGRFEDINGKQVFHDASKFKFATAKPYGKINNPLRAYDKLFMKPDANYGNDVAFIVIMLNDRMSAGYKKQRSLRSHKKLNRAKLHRNKRIKRTYKQIY